MSDWSPIVVLPSIDVGEPIEGGRIALVPVDDDRVKTISAGSPTFRTFIGRFTDPFRRPVRPSVLIGREPSSRRSRNADTLASFRDLISVSTIARSRARELIHSRPFGVIYANAFAFYPWMVGRDGKHLVGSTPAHAGFDDVKTFHGQSSPDMLSSQLSAFDLDEPLLTELIRRWRQRYFGRGSEWRDLALFRSLNMANQASQLPAGADVTRLDIGRMIALWVSAFEILAHPGVGRSDTQAVFALLNSVTWLDAGCRARRYNAEEKAGKVARRSILACWLYGELYRTRNQFLHGNPLTRRTGLVPKSRNHLLRYAAPLYRMALTGFLDLQCKEPLPPTSDVDEFAKAVSRRIHFQKFQDDVEMALLTSRMPREKVKLSARRAATRYRRRGD